MATDQYRRHGPRTVSRCEHCATEFQPGRRSQRFCSYKCRGAFQTTNTPTDQRFWRLVAKAAPSECWEWTGCKGPRGYGALRGKGRTTQAHRFSYELHNGPIDPPSLFVCHHCDNPGCVNPAHLFLGTHTDNMHDSQNKLRNHAKLTPGSVRAIRQDTRRIADIAAAHGISVSNVMQVRARKTWAHIQ